MGHGWHAVAHNVNTGSHALSRGSHLHSQLYSGASDSGVEVILEDLSTQDWTNTS